MHTPTDRPLLPRMVWQRSPLQEFISTISGQNGAGSMAAEAAANTAAGVGAAVVLTARAAAFLCALSRHHNARVAAGDSVAVAPSSARFRFTAILQA